MCDNCVASPQKRLDHEASHVFFPIKTPGMNEAYLKACKRVEQPPVVPPRPEEVEHKYVHCDECGESPLVGVRHKCLDCNGE